MSKFKFIKVRDEDNKFDTYSMEMEVETCTLPDLLESFEYFLKGAGFNFKGSIIIDEHNIEGDSDEN